MIWLGLAFCLLFSLLLTGLIRHHALARNFVDVPNQRSSHCIETPHGGGVAIVLAFQLMLGFLLFFGYQQMASVQMYLIAASGIAMIGLLDDIRHIPARWRLLAHFLGAALALPDTVLPVLTLSLALGTPALSLIGAIGAAITVGVRRGGLLLSILVLPLYIPTLIFGARVVENALLDLATLPALALTAAITLLAAAIAPFAAAAALRINAR